MRRFEKRVLDEQAHMLVYPVVAPHRSAPCPGARLDDQPEPLPESGFVDGVAGALARRATRAQETRACSAISASGSS